MSLIISQHAHKCSRSYWHHSLKRFARADFWCSFGRQHSGTGTQLKFSSKYSIGVQTATEHATKSAREAYAAGKAAGQEALNSARQTTDQAYDKWVFSMQLSEILSASPQALLMLWKLYMNFATLHELCHTRRADQCTVLGLEIQRWDGIQYVSSKEHLDHNARLAKLAGAKGRGRAMDDGSTDKTFCRKHVNVHRAGQCFAHIQAVS